MGHKRVIDCLDAIAEAVALLKQAGFVLDHYARSGTTTCYYRYPGREGFIRVSTHSSKKAPIGLNGVLAKLTYAPDHKHCRIPGTMRLSEVALRHGVVVAIGQYFLGSPKPSRYEGPRIVDGERPTA
jgi:hypothetical protein